MLQQKKSISIYFPRTTCRHHQSLSIVKDPENQRSQKHFPVISVGDKPLSCQFDSVELDSRKQGHIMANYLLSFGHTNITYISTPIRGKEIGRIHRLDGIKSSFREHGIPLEHLTVLYQNQPAFDR